MPAPSCPGGGSPCPLPGPSVSCFTPFSPGVLRREVAASVLQTRPGAGLRSHSQSGAGVTGKLTPSPGSTPPTHPPKPNHQTREGSWQPRPPVHSFIQQRLELTGNNCPGLARTSSATGCSCQQSERPRPAIWHGDAARRFQGRVHSGRATGPTPDTLTSGPAQETFARAVLGLPRHFCPFMRPFLVRKKKRDVHYITYFIYYNICKVIIIT